MFGASQYFPPHYTLSNSIKAFDKYIHLVFLWPHSLSTYVCNTYTFYFIANITIQQNYKQIYQEFEFGVSACKHANLIKSIFVVCLCALCGALYNKSLNIFFIEPTKRTKYLKGSFIELCWWGKVSLQKEIYIKYSPVMLDYL